jgi:hypothetical protein
LLYTLLGTFKIMTVGERIDLLVNATDDYAEIRLKTSDQFIEMMKFMFSEKYKLIEQKEKEYEKLVLILKNL